MKKVGETYGRLTIEAKDEKRSKEKKETYWLCSCSCGNPELVSVSNSNLGKTVNSCGCLRKENTKKLGAKTAERERKKNKYDLITEEYGIGWTDKGYQFFFDLEDFDKIKNYYWEVQKGANGYLYLRTCINSTNYTMSNFIMKGRDKENKIIYDHKNQNSLDNRKSNLRIASVSENGMNVKIRKNNTSGIIGVHQAKDRKWVASIRINKKRTCLGRFEKKEDAIIERLKAEKEYYGEFAPQKELFDKYDI